MTKRELTYEVIKAIDKHYARTMFYDGAFRQSAKYLVKYYINEYLKSKQSVNTLSLISFLEDWTHWDSLKMYSFITQLEKLKVNKHKKKRYLKRETKRK